MRFARAVLFLVALGYLAFGVAFTLFPATLAAVVDIRADAPNARTDLRGIYGGLEIGLAAFLFACLRRPEWTRAGLLCATLTIGAIGLVHAAGVVIDRPTSPIVLGSTAMELAAAALALLAYRAATRAHG